MKILDFFVGIPDHDLDGCRSKNLEAKIAKNFISKSDLLKNLSSDDDFYDDDDDSIYRFGMSGRVAHIQFYSGFKEAKEIEYLKIDWALENIILNIIVGLDPENMRVVCVPSSSVYIVFANHLKDMDKYRWFNNGRSLYEKPYWIWEKVEPPVLPGHPVLPAGYVWTPFENEELG